MLRSFRPPAIETEAADPGHDTAVSRFRDLQ